MLRRASIDCLNPTPWSVAKKVISDTKGHVTSQGNVLWCSSYEQDLQLQQWSCLSCCPSLISTRIQKTVP
jgi:hypothetical protein